MAGMNADFINPFLMSATKIMQEICQTEMKIGKPYVKTTEFENKSVAVMIGITGELKGQVIMAFEFNKALQVDEFYRKDGNLQGIMLEWMSRAI